VLVETDPTVATFCEQPLRVQVGSHHSILDMWVKKTDGAEYFAEVKYQRDLIPTSSKSYERVARQIATQREWCTVNEWGYQLMTDHEIRSNALFLKNMKTLLPYLRSYRDMSELDELRTRKCLQGGPTTLGELLKQLGPRALEVIAHLYMAGKIHCEFERQSINHQLGVRWHESKSYENGFV